MVKRRGGLFVEKAKSVFTSTYKVVFHSSIGIIVTSVVCSTCTVLTCMLTPIGTKIMRHYIMGNPGDIIASFQAFEKRESASREHESMEAAKGVFEEVIKDHSAASIGNADGAHKIVVFFDYSCGHCAREMNELNQILSSRNDVKIIFQDFPILNMNSLASAKAGIFVAKKHPALLAKFATELFKKQIKDENAIKEVAKSLGISTKELGKAITGAEYDEVLRINYTRAEKLKLKGTPAVIVDGKLFLGAVSATEILAAMDGTPANNTPSVSKSK